MQATEWIRCPVCSKKTRLRIRIDTVLIKFPLYCPKCKQETLISVKELHTSIIIEPDAEPYILTTGFGSVFFVKSDFGVTRIKTGT